MDKKRLTNIIKRPESPKLDFKQLIDVVSEGGRKEFAKDVCAIANSKGGRGYIILGIEDGTKRVIGINDMEISEEQVQQIVSSRIDPPIPISLEITEYEGKKIGVITIYDGPNKPYQIKDNGAFLIRRGSTTDTMRKQEIIAALQESFSFNAETFPIVGSNMNSINMNLVKKYFDSKGLKVSEEAKKELLESASIIYMDRESGSEMATLGGLLVFSAENYLFVPQNFIRVVNRLEGRKRDDIIIQGDLLSIIDKSQEVLNDCLPDNYPVDAVFEAVMNAVIYRDYTVYYKEIMVIIDDNSVSVISPGVFADSKNTITSSYYKRNMWIYEKIVSMDSRKRLLKEEKGFTKMKKSFKNIGKVMFINNINENSFKVIFPGINRLK